MSRSGPTPGAGTGYPGGAAQGEAAARLLAKGAVTIKGRIPWSSNATYLVEVSPAPEGPGPGASPAGQPPPPALAIYKPERGERPLWDFGRGLWRREVASYLMAAHLGWDIVPVTVAREDAPLGQGSLQLFVDAEADEHYFTLVEVAAHRRQLRQMAAFDIVVNNADRKSGHCLLGRDGRLWAIDNGLTFHVEPKLRTVIWDFAGQKVDDDLVGQLAMVGEGDLPPGLAGLLEEQELEAVSRRAARLARRSRFPQPSGDFPYPWPLI